MQIKNKRWAFIIYTLLYLGNQTLLAVSAHNNASMSAHNNASMSAHNNTSVLTTDNATILNSNTITIDQENITIQDVNDDAYMSTPDNTMHNKTAVTPDNTSSETFEDLYSDLDLFEPIPTLVLSLENTSAVFEVAILVQGTGSMRLRSSDAEDMDNAVLQWYTYCNAYVQDTWSESGHGQSPLVLSFDWVRIDDTRLDVFFVGVYPMVHEGAMPTCLSSEETFQSTGITADACSALTLGGFGEHLISGSNAKLVVRTKQIVTALPKHVIYMLNVHSVNVHRLGVSASFIDVPQLILHLDTNSRSSIFDNSIVNANTSHDKERHNATYNLSLYEETKILVQATAAMRIKSDDMDDIDNAILQWYYYCESYVEKAWNHVGYDKSSLQHTYDWVKVDDSTLNVFFVGRYTPGPNTISVRCLSSTETMQNTTSLEDACSQLTLGGFGDDLNLANRAKIKVSTNSIIMLSNDLQTHVYVAKMVPITRMSYSFSLIQIQQQRVALQAENSRISIFDNSIRFMSASCNAGQGHDVGGHCGECSSGDYSLMGSTECHPIPAGSFAGDDTFLRVHGKYCGFITDAVYTQNAFFDGKVAYSTETAGHPTYIYWHSWGAWVFANVLGMDYTGGSPYGSITGGSFQGGGVGSETLQFLGATNLPPIGGGYRELCMIWPRTQVPNFRSSSVAVSIGALKSCRAESSALDSLSEECRCNAGFANNEVGSCTACSAGKYSIGRTNLACKDPVCTQHLPTVIAERAIALVPTNDFRSRGPQVARFAKLYARTVVQNIPDTTRIPAYDPFGGPNLTPLDQRSGAVMFTEQRSGTVANDPMVPSYVDGTGGYKFDLVATGFTAVVTFKLTQPRWGWETIFRIHGKTSANRDGHVHLYRWNTDPRPYQGQILVRLWSNVDSCNVLSPTGVVMENVWTTVRITYDHSGCRLSLFHNGVTTWHICADHDWTFTATNTLLSNTVNNYNAHGDFAGAISGFFAVDQLLDAGQIQNVIDIMSTKGGDVLVDFGGTDGISKNIRDTAIALVPGYAKVSSLSRRMLDDSIGTATFDPLEGPDLTPQNEKVGTFIFNRPQNQFLNGGSSEFKVASNLFGFTAVIVLQGRRTKLAWEPIFHFGGDDNGAITLNRKDATTSLSFMMSQKPSNGNKCILETPEGFLPQDKWLTIRITYNPNTRELVIRSGSLTSDIICPEFGGDMNVLNTYIGHDPVRNTYFHGALAGFYTVDKMLNDEEIAEIVSAMHMKNGDTLLPTSTGVDVCQSCPVHSTAPSGSSSASDCVCDTGFEAGVDESTGKSQCVCKAGLEASVDESTGKTQCVCKAGFTGPNAGQCTKCDAGKHKMEAGNALCTDCEAGKFSDGIEIGCQDCSAPGTYSVAGSTVCSVCGAGTGLQTGTCRDCDAGKFSDGIEIGCRDCGSGKYAPTPGSEACDPCEFGGVSSDRSNCILPQPPKILSGENKVVFMHFKAETTVKSILAQVSPQNWQNGDTVTIYENGARGLNPLVFVYNTDWSPVNIDPIHHRDNVYVIRTPRSDIGIGVELMSIVWQDTSGVELLSGQDYTQTISMQVHYLRKQHGVDLTDTISTLNADYSYYRPFGVRIINNLPTRTTNIYYSKP